jgi:hypothetical protein
MAKHTPGPWVIVGARLIWSPGAKANIAAVSELRSSQIVEYKAVEIGSGDFGEICANARLIAAAPQLLEACRAVCEHVSLDVYRKSAADMGRMEPAITAFEKVRAAIKAAEEE